jgi:hypothetical protein
MGRELSGSSQLLELRLLSDPDVRTDMGRGKIWSKNDLALPTYAPLDEPGSDHPGLERRWHVGVHECGEVTLQTVGRDRDLPST